MREMSNIYIEKLMDYWEKLTSALQICIYATGKIKRGLLLWLDGASNVVMIYAPRMTYAYFYANLRDFFIKNA